MNMTSVTGHMMELEFDQDIRKWTGCNPIELFDKAVYKTVKDDAKDIKKTLVEEAKKASILLLWLDCDLEGENIAYEVISVCQEANRNIEVFRARFSALIPRDIMRTLNHPDRPNKDLNDAVEARQEIDLRIGAAFTRFQTLRLQNKYENMSSLISYGPCQFPTLGFIVDRYQKIEAFISEKFWLIECSYDYEDPDSSNGSKLLCKFNWDRSRVYDRFAVFVLYDNCLESGGKAIVTKCDDKPTTKRRPIPLNTVELQKRASRQFRLSSERTMQVAEALYQRGILSYPRTETEVFKEGTELNVILNEHRGHSLWGQYVNGLLDNGGFLWPIHGSHDDQAHPPIHPTKCVEAGELKDDEAKIYDLVTRHFLACCSKDARGSQTTIQIRIPHDDIDGETFTGTGLMIVERNFLDVYSKYDGWTANKVPLLKKGDTFYPSKLLMNEGQTTPPQPLSESDLITEMDRHNIGTDATIATHITTVQQREYAEKDEQNRFVPTKLGIALIEAYNEMGYQLNKPYLRASMEADCQKIAKGLISKDEVVKACLDGMKKCFIDCNRDAAKLDAAVEKYFTPIGGGHAIEAYRVITRNISECGTCLEKMDLKEDEANRRVLHCKTCKEIHRLPPHGIFSAHAQRCMICGFQVLNVKNEETNKEHTLCPKCFKNPPGPPFSGENAAEFRCFMCCEFKCPLAGGRGGPDISPCPDPNCSGKLKLQKKVISCDGPVAHKIFIPKCIISSSLDEAIVCENCSRKFNARVLKLQAHIDIREMHHLLPNESFCIICEWDSTFNGYFPGFSSLNRNNNQQQGYQQRQQPLPQQNNQRGGFQQPPNRPQNYQQQEHRQQNQNNQNNNMGFQNNNMGFQQPQHHQQAPSNNNFKTPFNFNNNNNNNNNNNSTSNRSNHAPMDYSAASTGTNYNKSTSRTGHVNESNGGNHQCPQCGVPAIKRTTLKAGNNQGRVFYKCPTEPNCTYFKWEDEIEGSSSAGMTCSNCKQVGHFARSCPKKR
jgi:DNA topoisomerase-3